MREHADRREHCARQTQFVGQINHLYGVGCYFDNGSASSVMRRICASYSNRITE
jgi:hypothetical protein